ncbi:MAG: efflux RND transporter permease subunit [Verrucomicrobiota bacterium]|nr:efflux RND transporter permease subunit [Verrucomicrobiota bacterium]
MNITDLFIRRPVLALVVNILLLVAGVASIAKLNVRQYPKSDISVVSVTTVYVGASADLVRGFITTPLERVIASSDGIDYIESTSYAGVSTINAHLRLNYDPNQALTQIISKVNQVKNQLPQGSEEPVVDIESPDSRFASMYLGFYSTELKQNQITDYLSRVVQPRLSSVAGVQRADILGARVFAMRIWLQPEQLAAYNISPAEVYDALAANNYLSAIGAIKGNMTTVNLTANTDLKSPEEFKNLVIREKDGAIIRLRDLANVELGAESYDEDVRFDGQSATFMGVWVLPTANSLDVIQAVRAIIPEIEKGLPSGLKVGIPYDATKYINDSIHEIAQTLMETLLIVVIVIFLFLGSVRSVFIPVVAMPLSLIGAIFLMFVLGFTINLLTLLAIVLAVGLVVDDAIVVLENIERHIRLGKKPIDAALVGARELVGPIIAMSITLATVYIPIGFTGGLTGALFREFAFTLAGAVVISGFVALTLSPMMASRILHAEHNPKGLAEKLNHVFDALKRWYQGVLAGTLKSRPVVYTVYVIVLLLIPGLYLFSPKELAPVEDQGVLFGIIQPAPNASLEQNLGVTDQIFDIYSKTPEVANVFQITGPNFGFSGLVTKPWGERERTTKEILGGIQGQLAMIPGAEVFATVPPPLPGGSNFPIEFVIASTAEPEEIYGIAQQLAMKANESGKFMFAFADLRFDRPETKIVIDRDKAAALGLDMRTISNDLGAALGGGYVNRFSIQGRSYKVIPQVTRSSRLTTDQLKSIYIRGPEGKLISLDTIATLEHSTQPRDLKRFQQLNCATISGSQLPHVSKDEALKFLEEEATKLFPEGRGYRVDYAGESRQLRLEGDSGMAILGLAGILIFLVLAAQFESFRDPFIILLGSVPLALAGSLITTFFGWTSLNIYSQVGLVTLVGLVAKNGILIVEFANQLQREGKSKLDAVKEAAATRLRPILMTSAATVCGHFPLVLVTGAGAAARNSIGTVLVAGMTIGTLFTLFVVPSIYMLIAYDVNKIPESVEDPTLDPPKPSNQYLKS